MTRGERSDEIERLRAERDRYRAALESAAKELDEIAEHAGGDEWVLAAYKHSADIVRTIGDLTHAALHPEEDPK